MSTPQEDSLPPPPLDCLKPATAAEVKKIVTESKTTTCNLDPIPTSFLKVLMNVLLPILTNIINMSFDQGIMPSELKRALVTPLLKKLGMDVEVLKNFRPVSNLPFLSKLIERVAAKRLLSHMSLNGLHEPFQSAYKQFHSTETALLRIQSDILLALDQRKCVLLVMLDLSAAFDTIDHNTLLSRLKSAMGLTGKALDWFKSYISGRKQSIFINGIESSLWELIFGVPQGSVLGPLLFIIYLSPLGQLLKSLGIQYHFYADDSQIYITFDVKNASDAVRKIEEAVSVIRTWMADNFLCLNEEKTEVILIASNSSHQKLNIPNVIIGNERISPASEVQNIGYVFDHIMSARKQVSFTCKSAWFHLRSIAKIRPYLDTLSTERLIHAFVTSKIDINNSLLYGIPETLLQKLQLIQNAAARLITKKPKYCHITPILKGLHWLPVHERIQYKILLTVFKALNGLSPVYITDMICKKPDASRSLRSNGQCLLVVKKSNTVRYGDRNFRNAAPTLWNSLPQDLRCHEDINCFKRGLKTLLYKAVYNV